MMASFDDELSWERDNFRRNQSNQQADDEKAEEYYWQACELGRSAFNALQRGGREAFSAYGGTSMPLQRVVDGIPFARYTDELTVYPIYIASDGRMFVAEDSIQPGQVVQGALKPVLFARWLKLTYGERGGYPALGFYGFWLGAREIIGGVQLYVHSFSSISYNSDEREMDLKQFLLNRVAKVLETGSHW